MSTVLQDTPYFDWELTLVRTANDAAIARELLGMFIHELPEQQADIRTAFENQDMDHVKTMVHKLHGSTCYIGAPHLKHAAHTFEMALNDGQQAQWPSCYAGLMQSIDATLAAIKAAGVLDS